MSETLFETEIKSLITIAAKLNACTVLDRSNTGVVGSNLPRVLCHILVQWADIPSKESCPISKLSTVSELILNRNRPDNLIHNERI
jgi:hypothetical protein